MKKRIFCIILALLMLCGCNTDKNNNKLSDIKKDPSASTSDTKKETLNKKDETEKTEIPAKSSAKIDIPVLYEDEKGNTAEIPQIIGEENDAVKSINKKITDWYADVQKEVKSGDEEWYEIYAFPTETDRYLNLVVSFCKYPTYATYGSVLSWVYDKETGKEITLSEAVGNVDEDKLISDINDFLSEDDWFPTATRIDSMAFRMTADGKAELLVGVDLESPESGDVWATFFAWTDGAVKCPNHVPVDIMEITGEYTGGQTYWQKYLAGEKAALPSKDETIARLNALTEVSNYIDSGKDLFYNESIEYVDGVLCSCVWLGTGTADKFTKDILYAVNSEGIYRYDQADDEWTQIEYNRVNEGMLKVLKGSDSLSEYKTKENAQGWNEYYQVLEVKWDTLRLGDESAKEYPKLAAALEDMRMTYNAYENDAFNVLLPDALQIWEDSQGNMGYFSRESEIYVQRADKHVLSFRENFYQYTGGARPQYFTYGINIDPDTGEYMMLSEIVADMDKLSSVLYDAAVKEYPDFDKDYIAEALEASKLDNYNWNVDYMGLVFYFNEYEIINASFGTQIVRIGFDEIYDIVDEKYLSVPEYGYAVELPLYEDVFVDIDAEDGALDVLSVSPSMNEDAPDWYDGFTIMIGDSECEEKDLSFGRIVPYYVYLGDYNSYLYLELTSENDYNTLMVYDISYGYPSWSMTLEGTGFDSMYYEEDEYFAEEVLTDPSKFTLTTRVEVLGTHSGRKTYHANAYFGDPETIDNAYDMSLYGDFITVTSSRPLEVVMISTGEKETIPAGTKFEYLRTDNESFAELRLEDGRVCRVSVDVTEYPALINGISEDDCFSDIMYAG